MCRLLDRMLALVLALVFALVFALELALVFALVLALVHALLNRVSIVESPCIDCWIAVYRLLDRRVSIVGSCIVA